MWNDAGIMATYDLTFRSRGRSALEIGYIKIMRRDMPIDSFALTVGEVEQLRPSFCALGQSYSFYERILEIPDQMGIEFLTRVRDVVTNPRVLHRFENDRIFKNSLLREGRAIRALEDAPQLFRTNSDALKSTLPREMTATVRLGRRDVTFDLDFRDLLEGVPSRVAALVGDNGTGKSHILGQIAKSVLERDSQTSKAETTLEGIYSRSRPGDAINFARVITIAYGAFDSHAIYRTRPDTETRKVRDVSDSDRYFYRGLQDVASNSKPVLKSSRELEEELWTDLIAIRDERRYFAFVAAIKLLQDTTEFPQPVVDELLSRSPRRVALSDLSSGQMVVLNILVSLVAYLEPGSLVLIDEPEVHLHPPMVSAMMRGIAAALADFESVAIVATHSSVVVQELPARNVRVLRRVEDVTTAREPEIETYGESLGTIGRHVFGLAGIPLDFLKVLESIDADSLSEAQRRLGIPLSTQAMTLLLQHAIKE